MKAAQISSYGGNENIRISETAVPELKPHQILVAVHAASINPFDLTIRSGGLAKFLSAPLPLTLGGDFAGVVEKTGDEVSAYSPGDHVYGQAVVANGGTGTIAEFTAANETNISKKPLSLSYEEAAALPLAGASALQAVADHISLSPGQKILIHGGSGGIGSLAIQIAKHYGAYVATTVRGDAAEYVRSLGADYVIDHTAEKFEDTLQDYDAVFDTAGGDIANRSLSVLKKGGILVTMIADIDEAAAAAAGVTAIRQMTQTTTDILTRLARLADEGHVKPQIDRTFPLADTQQAFQYFEKEHPKGKVIIALEER